MKPWSATVNMARQLTGQTQLPSPCISLCKMDEASGLCLGCLRRLSEIAAWSTMDDADKLVVWGQLPGRAEVMALARTNEDDQ